MQPFAGAGWEAWAPPLDPPTEGGLPYEQAEAIAVETGWPAEPHLTAAEQWEAYAAIAPASAPVASVNTGTQSVSYAAPYGAALARAEWHRSFLGNLVSVPLQVAPVEDEVLVDPWWIDP